MPLWLQCALERRTVVTAFKLAMVVGTLLVIINQGEAVFGDANVNWLKLVLTYMVPYGVSTYTSVSKDLAARD
jgi:hypothetical protein